MSPESPLRGDGVRLGNLLKIPGFDADYFWPNIPLLLVLGDDEGYLSTGMIRLPGAAASGSTSAFALRDEVKAAPDVFEALVVPVALKRNLPERVPISLGRSHARDVCLNHPTISKFHAQFIAPQTDEFWRIRDVASVNGTWVDGCRLGPDDTFIVRNYSDLTFGGLHCRFVMPGAVSALVDLMQDEADPADTDPDVDGNVSDSSDSGFDINPEPARAPTVGW